MQASPLFSIITPSFNQGAFIARTIESVIQQEGNFEVELIVVDGASTDDTVEILRRYETLLAPGGERHRSNFSFRWFSEPDDGQSNALNKGFRMARGDIVGWLNSDDHYCEGALQSVGEYFELHEHCDIVYGNSIAIDVNNQELWRQHPKPPSVYRLIYVDSLPQPSVFFRRRLLDRLGLVDEALHYTMDADLWVRFVIGGARFCGIDRYLAVQLYHIDSKSLQGEAMFEAFLPEIRHLKSKYRPFMGRWFYFHELARVTRRLAGSAWMLLPARIRKLIKYGVKPADNRSEMGTPEHLADGLSGHRTYSDGESR